MEAHGFAGHFGGTSFYGWGHSVLTDTECRKAKARERDYKLSDAQGLYLFVTKAGGKSWRMKYRYAGKEKRLTFGPYPEVTLLEARRSGTPRASCCATTRARLL